MAKISIIQWDDKKAKEKAILFRDDFNKLVQNRSSKLRKKEDIYKSDFYKNSLYNLKSINDTYKLDNKFQEWVAQSPLNHSFTFVRLLHSMLISNEPIATASPSENSEDSRLAANCADKLCKWAREEYEIKKYIDQWVLHTLIYGLGVLRVNWNGTLGAILDSKVDTGEVIYDGDLELRVVMPDNYMLFSTSNDLNDVYGYLERLYVDKEILDATYPDLKDKFVVTEENSRIDPVCGELKTFKNKVILYEYFEEALPYNAKQGRYMLFTDNGDVIELANNPVKDKSLPIVLFPDVVVPDSLYPLSILDYLEEPQRNLNDLMSRVVENVKMYARVFLLVDRQAKLADEALTDSPVVPVEYTSADGGRPPIPMTPPSLPAFVFKTHDILVDMMQHLSGIRDFSRGVMSKNVSGFATNLMIEADNKVHIQVHERYKEGVKRLYQLILTILQDNMSDGKAIKVVGKEDEIDYFTYKKDSLVGGYDVQVDYGTSLPLDPAGKRQAIREMTDYAKQLGIQVDPSKVLNLVKMGDVLGTYDIPSMAKKRQKEETKLMTESLQYKYVDLKTEDHLAHYTEMFEFFQSKEYVALEEDVKQLLKQHAQMHLMAVELSKLNVTDEQFMGVQDGTVNPATLVPPMPPMPQGTPMNPPSPQNNLPQQG